MERGVPIERSRLGIDNNQFCTSPECHLGQHRRGMDGQRRAKHQHRVDLASQPFGPLPGGFGQSLAKEGNVGLVDASASGPMGNGLVPEHRENLVKPFLVAAVEAVVQNRRTVHLIDARGASFLVQHIDILGNNSF